MPAAEEARQGIMCGRYVQATPPDELARLFGTTNPLPNLKPTWNMAPTRTGPVVRRHPQTGKRHLDGLRWGLIPHWTRDAKSIRQPINARSETAATSPYFRDALRDRRCLVPADAFYEWRVAEDGPGKQGGKASKKQPYAIARADGQVMAFAGLWEGWRSPDGEAVRTYTLLTTEANDQLRPLHDRMTVVLEPEDWATWLGETEGDYHTLLRPSRTQFRVWPVGPAVSNVRNEGAELLNPA